MPGEGSMNTVALYRSLDGRFSVHVGDITTFSCDAIVNAANSTLLGGGGVDGAIHRAAGPALLDACRIVRSTLYPEGLPTGKAVATIAGNLPARRVIHTVGPIWRGGNHNEDALLASCYRECMRLAREEHLLHIAFPAISTGVYGFPRERAAHIVWQTVQAELATNALPRHVSLIFYSEDDAGIFLRENGLPARQ